MGWAIVEKSNDTDGVLYNNPAPLKAWLPRPADERAAQGFFIHCQLANVVLLRAILRRLLIAI